MKCPRCGRDLKDNETFCPVCGCRPADAEQSAENAPETGKTQPDAKPKIGRIIMAVLSVLLYIGLMFGCQSCVMSGYMTSLIMEQGLAAELSEEALIGQAQNLISSTEEKIVEILLIANLLTLLIVCGMFHLRKKSPAREMGLYWVNPFRLITFAVFGSALNVFFSVTLPMLPLPEEILESVNSQFAGLYSGTSIFMQIAAVAIAAPVIEELIFRGIGMTRLTPLVGTGAAVVITAILFGFAHGSAVAVLYAVAVGAMFALMYARYGSVIPPLVAHVFFNLTSFGLAEIEENSMVLIGVYVIAVAMILWCVYRIFIRYPTFNDVLSDRDARIRPINQTEADIMMRLNAIQQKTDHDLDELSDELEELEKKWSENRKNYKKK